MATETMSNAQKELFEKHGTPEQFETAVWECVPWMISVTEADDAIRKYRIDWAAAGTTDRSVTQQILCAPVRDE